MYHLYKVVLEDEHGETVEYEYGDSEQEALELVLGRRGTSVRVKKVKSAHRNDLLDATRRLYA